MTNKLLQNQSAQLFVSFSNISYDNFRKIYNLNGSQLAKMKKSIPDMSLP